MFFEFFSKNQERGQWLSENEDRVSKNRYIKNKEKGTAKYFWHPPELIFLWKINTIFSKLKDAIAKGKDAILLLTSCVFCK